MSLEPNQSPLSGPPGEGSALFDLGAALERMDGDVSLLNEVIDIFLEDYQNCMEEVRNAAAKKDSALLQRAAHTVKGAVGNFVSARATDLARDVELLSKQGDLDQALALLGDLERAVGDVADGLREYRRKDAA
jgi:HPt (histidine-containing phosphotransfer) domain-containing protein